jgi:hypothetical protein
MATIQWRPEYNPLTVPQSCKLRFLPREIIGLDEIAAEIEADNPTYNQALAKAVISAFMRKMQQSLINGKQVTIEDFLTFTLSFTGRLDSPDETPANLSEMLQVKAYASQPFVKEVRHAAQFERLPMPTEKVPMIVSAEDTRLKLNDVLYTAGVLQLSGSNLFTEEAQEVWECVLEGTRSGRAVQSQFGPVSATGIVVVPNIPPQDAPWNNEYMVSVSTRYTEKGTLRTGTYRRRLRSPLTVAGLGHPHPQETGILTDHAAAAYVSVTGGSVSADEMLRIQAVLDLRENRLLVSLLDMKEDGQTGAAVLVTGNGDYLLQGFAGSAVSNLAIKVNNFSALAEMVRNAYAGRVVDVLAVKTGN